jgi:hypothetical protein
VKVASSILTDWHWKGPRRPRDPFFSDDTSLSMYMDPLSTLAEYRFPPDDLQNVALPPVPHTISNAPFDSHTPVETADDSLPISEGQVSSGQDILWQDTKFLEGSSIYPDESFPR